MKSILTLIITVAMSMTFLTACTRQNVGMATGGVLGGIAGSALTGGSTAGTVVGAVGGGLLGSQVAR